MATPNYGYEKRQRELAKKKKKEEKLRAKAAGRPHSEADVPEGQDAGPANAPADAPSGGDNSAAD